MSVRDPQRRQLYTDAPCHSRCGRLKNLNCSMTTSTKHRSTFEAFHLLWWCFYVIGKFSNVGRKPPNKQNICCRIQLLYSFTFTFLAFLFFNPFFNGSSVLYFLFYPTFTKTIPTPNFVKIPEKNIVHVTRIWPLIPFKTGINC